MESKKVNNDIFEETKKLEELLDVDNVEAITPDNNDIISLGEESVIEDCLNDTDGSLSSVNLDFFNDDTPRPAKGRRKKTMEKRKEERISFKHLVDDKAASDNEDDEDSSISSLSPIDRDFWQQLHSMPSTSKKSDVTDTVKVLDSNILLENSFQRELRRFRLQKKILQVQKKLEEFLRTPKSDKERKSKLDELNDDFSELERIPSKTDDDIPFRIRGTQKLLRSKSVEELRRNCEEDKAESANEAINDIETPSTLVGGLKRIRLPEGDEEEEVNNDDLVPTSSKHLNVVKKKVVRRKRRVSAKREEVANNTHIYSFFSSMADLVSTLPYSTTLTAKARVTKMLEEMVERLEKNSDGSPLNHEISEEDLKLIKLRLSRLPYIY